MQYTSELISIIVPVYNTEPYLDRCIKSIIGQTYENLEIILVDDGSTDRSGQICDVYKKMDKRIKVIHKQNGGAASARNRGLKIAEGKYIGFVDSDDYVAPDMYESLLRCLDMEVDITTCGRCHIYPAGARGIKRKTLCAQREKKCNTQQAVAELLKGKLFSYGVCEKLYRKELFDGVSFPNGRVSEDLPVTYALFKKSRNVVNIGKARYYQFHRKDSVSRKEFFPRRIDNVIFHRDILEDIKENYPELGDIAEVNYIESVIMRLNEIKESKDRMLYVKLEKRLIKVLRRMRLRIIFNQYLNQEQKKRLLKL